MATYQGKDGWIGQKFHHRREAIVLWKLIRAKFRQTALQPHDRIDAQMMIIVFCPYDTLNRRQHGRLSRRIERRSSLLRHDLVFVRSKTSSEERSLLFEFVLQVDDILFRVCLRIEQVRSGQDFPSRCWRELSVGRRTASMSRRRQIDRRAKVRYFPVQIAALVT